MQGLCNGRVSVRLSVSSIDSNSAAVGFAAERGRLQQILIDSWYARSRRSAANAGSVMLRAEGRGSTQTCRLRYTLLSVAYRFAHRGDDTFSRAAVGWWRGRKSISMIAWCVAGFAPLAHSSSPALAACKHNATLSVRMDRYGSSSCIVSRYVLRVVKSLCLKLSLCSNYSVMCILFMFRVAQKGPHFLTCIFAKCWPIFKILVRLPWAIAVNL